MTASVSPQSSAREDYFAKLPLFCHEIVKEYLHPLQRISWALDGFIWPKMNVYLKDVVKKQVKTRSSPIIALKYPYLVLPDTHDVNDLKIDVIPLPSDSSLHARSISIGKAIAPRLSFVGSSLLVRGWRRPNLVMALCDMASGKKKVELEIPDLMQRGFHIYDTASTVLSGTTLATLHMQQSDSCVRIWDLATGNKESERSFSSAEHGAENLRNSYFFGERYIIPKDEQHVTVVDFGAQKPTVETCAQGTKVQGDDNFILCQDEDYSLMAQLRQTGSTTLILSSRGHGNQAVGTYSSRAESAWCSYSLICFYDTYFLVSTCEHLLCFDLSTQPPEMKRLLTWSEVIDQFSGGYICIAVDENYLAVVDSKGHVVIKEFEQKTPQSIKTASTP